MKRDRWNHDEETAEVWALDDRDHFSGIGGGFVGVPSTAASARRRARGLQRPAIGDGEGGVGSADALVADQPAVRFSVNGGGARFSWCALGVG